MLKNQGLSEDAAPEASHSPVPVPRALPATNDPSLSRGPAALSVQCLAGYPAAPLLPLGGTGSGAAPPYVELGHGHFPANAANGIKLPLEKCKHSMTG